MAAEPPFEEPRFGEPWFEEPLSEAERDGADTADPHGPEADPDSVARSIVLRNLTAQARTRAELEKALKDKRVPDDVAERVLDRMEAVGLVNDTAFAHDWVESRQQRRHLSKTALRRELMGKGVDNSAIESALGLINTEAELVAARSLAEKKLRSMGDLDAQVKYRRLAGALMRRGFGSATVNRVLAEALSSRRL